MRPRILAPCLSLVLLLAGAACDRGGDSDDDRGSERAETRPAGSIPGAPILPLNRILAIAAKAAPGEVVRIELESDHGREIYKLRVLTERGRMIELEIDAASGAILEQEAE